MRSRLNKFLASAGLGSRRKVEELIAAGLVTVNGALVNDLATTVDPLKDSVKVGGKRVRPRECRYYAFYKPKNVVTTLRDPEGRPSVERYLRRLPPGLKPVGRLDFASEGLILLTSDGDWAQAVQHPSMKVEKVYEVKVKGVPAAKTLERWTKGLVLDGKRARMEKVEPLSSTEADNTWLTITLTQGMTRQIRRMCESQGHFVMKLKRVAVGRVALGRLKPGEARELTEREVQSFVRRGKE
jgi:23S rRNA pseudouridine2605 synthase